MRGEEGSTEEVRRAVVYCVVPRELAAKLHDPLRRHFREDAAVEVIVERRGRERRAAAERRLAEADGRRAERRRIRNAEGRRVGDRRALVATKRVVDLPRRARPHADRLVFLERLEPSGQCAEDLDSARLVTRIQAGDHEAFGQLYERYFDRIYGFCRVLLKSQHDAEEITQEIFLDAFEGLPRYERRPHQPFRSWLFTLARNSTFTRLQRRSRVDLIDTAILDRRRDRAHDDADLSALGWITDRDLQVFIERLPLAQRQVLVLRYLVGLSAAQTAAVLGQTAESVRKQQSRALAFLRDRLTAVGRTPEGGKRVGTRLLVRHAPVLRLRRFCLTSASGAPGASRSPRA